MKKESLLLIHRILGILLGISVFVAGICLVAGCLSIYFTGVATGQEQFYSRQAVIETFSKIAIPVLFCLSLAVISFVFNLISPYKFDDKSNLKPYKQILRKLAQKKDVLQGETADLEAIMKEQKTRKILSVILIISMCVSAQIFLVYALNPNHYQTVPSTAITDSVIRALWVLTPCFLLPFFFAVFVAYYNQKSLVREIEIFKKIALKSQEIKDGPILRKSSKTLVITRILLLCIGVFSVVYGFTSGGTADVLTKAAKICTECIGLG